MLTFAGSPRNLETARQMGMDKHLKLIFRTVIKRKPQPLTSLSCKTVFNKVRRAPHYLSLEYCLSYLETLSYVGTRSRQLYIDLLPMKKMRGIISFHIDQQLSSNKTICSEIDYVLSI